MKGEGEEEKSGAHYTDSDGQCDEIMKGAGEKKRRVVVSEAELSRTFFMVQQT
jgi:hypothetical protein